MNLKLNKKAKEFIKAKISGIALKEYVIDKEYHYCYYHHDIYLLRQDLTNKRLFVDYTQIWQILEMRYSMSDVEIQSLIKDMVDKHLKIKGFEIRRNFFSSLGFKN